MHPDVLVVGAGIAGLTSAIRLAEDGWRVRAVADRDPLDTTSAVAAAIWLPYHAAPAERVSAWAHATHDVLLGEASDAASGVTVRDGRMVWRSGPDEALADLPESAPAPRAMEAVPTGFTGGALLRFPIIEMPLYLRWLVARLAAEGVTIEPRHVRSLDELAGEAPVVVHATGLAARAVVGDDTLFPIRGQVVRVENPGIDEFVLDQDAPTGVGYVIPRSRDVIVGGTAQVGAWDMMPDAGTRAQMLEHAITLEPRLAGARVLEDRVGLRPGRPEVRLEREDRPDGTVVIHDYGHGGSGVTIGWGCAAEVASLARTALSDCGR